MSETGFTPGPWTVADEEHEHEIVAGASFIASLPRERDPVFAANARLVAAAPDLLEALKKIAATDGQYSLHRCPAIARAAIAKATT